MEKYIKVSEIHNAILNYGKEAINAGKKILDPINDIVSLARLTYFLPSIEVEVECNKNIVIKSYK